MDAAAPGQTPPADLATRDALVHMDKRFLAALQADDAALFGQLMAARAEPDALDSKAESDLIVALGPHLEAFVATAFGIEREIAAIAAATRGMDPIHACKRLFVQRQAVKKNAEP